MGVPDTVTQKYMKDNYVFADACNFFFGEQIVDPESLSPIDTEEIIIPYIAGKPKKSGLVQKLRDVMKLMTVMHDGHAVYVLLGIENQTHVHFDTCYHNCSLLRESAVGRPENSA